MRRQITDYFIPAVSLVLGVLIVAVSRPSSLSALRDCCDVTANQKLQMLDILKDVPACPSWPSRAGTLLRVIGPDDCGTVVQIWCATDAEIDRQGRGSKVSHRGSQYRAIVKKSDPPGFERRLAKCNYERGNNAAFIWYVPDTNGNGRPDCFVFFRWWNDDDGADDDGDGKWDGDLYDYDFNKNSLTQTHLERGSPWEVVASQTTVVEYTGTEINDLVDYQVVPICQMYTSSLNLADIEHDRDVDADDITAFYSAFGSARGDANYLPMADLSCDGKVDGYDELLFNEALAGDIQPPIIDSITVTPEVIWPPNNQLVPLTVNATVSDAVDPSPTWKIIMVENNEDPECHPDEPTEVVHDDHALVRATRFGNGNGRIYTVTIQATDASGNSSRAQATVRVPKSSEK